MLKLYLPNSDAQAEVVGADPHYSLFLTFEIVIGNATHQDVNHNFKFGLGELCFDSESTSQRSVLEL